MLIPKKDRTVIFASLFREGVLVARKDIIHKHPTIPTRNLYVLKLMQSMESRAYVKHSYNWGYNYYYLTDAGIEYLRSVLHLADRVVPLTLTARKRTVTEGAAGPRGPRPEGGDRRPAGRGGAREGYYKSEGRTSRAPRATSPTQTAQ